MGAKQYNMAKLNFGGVEENVVTREEFPLAKAQEVLKNEIVAVIGYGVQGPGQALNQRDNGISVIVGQRKNSKSWDKAVRDGFIPGVSLFEIEEALEKGTIICYLLSDAAQIKLWPTVEKHLKEWLHWVLRSAVVICLKPILGKKYILILRVKEER